jgi:hypothetical protein
MKTPASSRARRLVVGEKKGGLNRSVQHYLISWSTNAYRMAARGKLPSFHLGGSVRFDSQEVANWLRLKYAADVGNTRKPPIPTLRSIRH